MFKILSTLKAQVSPTNQTKLMTALIVLPTYQFAYLKHLPKKSFIKLEFLPLLLYVSSCDHLSFLLRPGCKHKKSIFRLYVTFITNWDGAMPLQISLQLILKMVIKMCKILSVLEVQVSPTNQIKLMQALLIKLNY